MKEKYPDEENAGDWTPEIPFENVSGTLKLPTDLGRTREENELSSNFQLTSSSCEGFEETEDVVTEKPQTNVSMAEKVDEIMDHSIEIASNKRMRSANINVWSLKFKAPLLEKKVHLAQLRLPYLLTFLPEPDNLFFLLVRSDERGHVQIKYALLLHYLDFYGCTAVDNSPRKVSTE